MRKALLLAALIPALLCAGCADDRYPELPEEPIAFAMGTYTDHADDDAMYATIVYEGRTYMPYGTISRSMRKEDIAGCIGYLVQDGRADTDSRVYTLTDDPAHNYLMEYYIATNWMNQPTFWRAVDTRGQTISTPSCIDSLEYGFWARSREEADTTGAS